MGRGVSPSFTEHLRCVYPFYTVAFSLKFHFNKGTIPIQILNPLVSKEPPADKCPHDSGEPEGMIGAMKGTPPPPPDTWTKDGSLLGGPPHRLSPPAAEPLLLRLVSAPSSAAPRPFLPQFLAPWQWT